MRMKKKQWKKWLRASPNCYTIEQIPLNAPYRVWREGRGGIPRLAVMVKISKTISRDFECGGEEEHSNQELVESGRMVFVAGDWSGKPITVLDTPTTSI